MHWALLHYVQIHTFFLHVLGIDESKNYVIACTLTGVVQLERDSFLMLLVKFSSCQLHSAGSTRGRNSVMVFVMRHVNFWICQNSHCQLFLGSFSSLDLLELIYKFLSIGSYHFTCTNPVDGFPVLQYHMWQYDMEDSEWWGTIHGSTRLNSTLSMNLFNLSLRCFLKMFCFFK